MLASPDRRPARQRPPARRSAERLRDALLALAGGAATISRHVDKPWASVTFEGARHTVALCFEGCEAVSAGEFFIEALAEHEFAIPGHLVAEARVTAVDQRLAPDQRLEVTCELLLLRDA